MPGHPLFETVRDDVADRTMHDLQRGSVFYDLRAEAPYRLDFFAASIKDGRDNQLHRRLFAVQVAPTGELAVKQPTILLDLATAPVKTAVPDGNGLPSAGAVEQFLVEKALQPMLAETAAQRLRETQTIADHLEISLNELIHRQNLRLAELTELELHVVNNPATMEWKPIVRVEQFMVKASSIVDASEPPAP